MTIKEIVAAKLAGQDISEAAQELAIDEVKQTILNYCHIDTVPAALNYTWANMALDLLLYQQGVTSGETQTGPVSSISEGDTTVTFGGENAHQAKLDDMVLDYRAQLQTFRQVKWG